MLHNLLCTLPATPKRDWVPCLKQVLFCYNTTLQHASGESPYFLLLGQEQQLLFNFLLGRVPEPVVGSMHVWIIEHQATVHIAFKGAQNSLKVAAACCKQHYDCNVHDDPLEEDQLLYLCNLSMRDDHKIQDLWRSEVY